MSNSLRYSSPGLFLSACSSAFLFGLSRTCPELQFIIFLALVPMLRYVIRSSRRESIIIGLIVAFLSFVLIFTSDQSISLTGGLFKFLLLLIIFPLYAAIINRLARMTGFNAILAAAVWLPLEYIWRRLFGSDSLIIPPMGFSRFITGMATILGVLLVAFLVVLVNYVFLTLFTAIENILRACRTAMAHRGAIGVLGRPVSCKISSMANNPVGRAPPLKGLLFISNNKTIISWEDI
nr:hypothetical protein [candidate division Zixibacteria bacterium]